MRKAGIWLAGMVVVALAGAAAAEDPPQTAPGAPAAPANLTIEQRLERLEAEVVSLRKENAELRRALGVDGRAAPAVVKPAGKEPALQVGGLLQVQGETGDEGDTRFADDNDRIYLRRARLNAAGRLLGDFDFRVEVELSGTLASTSALRAQLTDGYVGWSRLGFPNVRAGQLKTPFGFEQLYPDPRLLTEERTLVNDRLTFGRQLGVQLSGDLLEKRLSYAVGLFDGNGANSSFNDNSRFLYAGRVSGTPWQGRLGGQDTTVTVGLDGFTTRDLAVAQAAELGLDSTPATPAADGLFTGTRDGFGLDAQVRWGPVDLWLEYLQHRFRPTDRIPVPTLTADGWYAQAGVYLLPKRLQGVVKLEAFDPGRHRADDETRTFTLGLNYYLEGHDLKLQLDYLNVDAPGESRQGKWIARVQTMF